MDYTPRPLDTANVRLGPEILELAEVLAKNTHDTWAQQRLADGWTYGPSRNDAAKQHPGLVPYEHLSETEKEYDRRTSLESLKAIILLGFRIEKPH